MWRILTFLFYVSFSVCLTVIPPPRFINLHPNLYAPPQQQNGCIDFHLLHPDSAAAQILAKHQNLHSEQIPGSYYLKKISKRIKQLTFCQNDKKWGYFVYLHHNRSIIHKQGYKIQMQMKHVSIHFSQYSGYVYALQTLWQLIEQGKGSKVALGKIQDEPIVSYRGIMIDPVRHFIGVEYVKKLILSMPIFKLNILHWHLSDDQAFVMELQKHPELASESRYSESEYYSLKQVKQILSLAKANAVSIVPEFDTPGHVRSWSRAEVNKNVTILCPGGQHYNHQLDLSQQKVYTLAKQVMAEVNTIFKDSPYIHLGGDQVFASCWDQVPAIKKFMSEKGLTTYGELQMYWRQQLKKVLPSRKIIYWFNAASSLNTSAEQTLQYWGTQSDTSVNVNKSQSSVILSPTDFLYINHGTTNIWVNKSNGVFVTWKQLYKGFTLRPENVEAGRILGAEVCLWNQMQNQDTLQNILWMRTAAFGAKVWRNQKTDLASLVTNLVAQQKVLISMGVQPSPVTNQFCEIQPNKCFSGSKYQVMKKITKMVRIIRTRNRRREEIQLKIND